MLATENQREVQGNFGDGGREDGVLDTSNIGAGSGRLPVDETEIAADVYVALLHFFDTFTELQNRPFVVTGESYAGKYIPSVGGLPRLPPQCTQQIREASPPRAGLAVLPSTGVAEGEAHLRGCQTVLHKLFK